MSQVVEDYFVDFRPILRQLKGSSDTGDRLSVSSEHLIGEIREFPLLGSQLVPDFLVSVVGIRANAVLSVGLRILARWIAPFASSLRVIQVRRSFA